MISSSQKRVLWTAAVGVPLLFLAVAVLQTKIDASPRADNEENSELLLRSGAAVRRMSLGYDSLAADVYWTRVVQYFGSRAGVNGAKFEELFPLLDIATTLDPKLIVAYRFGAVFLSEPPPQGAGRTDLAIELVKRGMAENPDNWYLPSDLGFLYYWRLKDYPAAAQAYLEGSKIPNAPSWMRIMAALVAQRGGSIETSRIIWTEIYNSTQDKNVRDRALKTLRGLRALEDEETLDGLAQQYKNRFGHFPASSSDLRDAGLIRGNPVDPEGYSYVFQSDGKARLDPQSPITIPPGLQLPGEASQ
jgi:tetratricopeptide (TPR) repeat protein